MDQYEVVEELGKGMYGQVFKIRRKKDGKHLVWKEINYGKLNQKETKWLTDEVNILKSLDWPNIVKYVERYVDTANTKIYIIMEYCENGDLKQIIDKMIASKDVIPEKFVWKILAQMWLALKNCHEHTPNKILHRDIKPGNIFLDKSNNVKLGDFGLSKLLDPDVLNTQTNVGTPYYMSPEQWGTEKDYGEKSDIWALGVVIYQMWALTVPFKARNYIELAQNIAKNQHNSIPEVYSDELKEMINNLLAKKSKNRPTAAQLWNYPKIRELNFDSKRKEHQKYIKLREASLDKREELIRKREEELKSKEQELEKLKDETLKLKEYYQAKIKKAELLSQSFQNENDKFRQIRYNTHHEHKSKYSHDNALSKTIDQGYDHRSSLGNDTNLKGLVHTSFERINSENQENINTDNTNLCSSGSSLTAKQNVNYTFNSHNLSNSNHFEDSQNDLSKSRKLSNVNSKYQSKGVRINLFEDPNSSGSSELTKTRPMIPAPSTWVSSRVTGSNGSDTALSKHIDSKAVERSLEFKTFSNDKVVTNSRLPPTGLNLGQKNALIDKDKSFTVNQNIEKLKLKRNYSTNQFEKLSNDENSRNRLVNRKSIPSTYRGDDLPTYVKTDNTMQITSARNHSSNKNDDLSSNSDLILNKANSVPQDQENVDHHMTFKKFTANPDVSVLNKISSMSNLNRESSLKQGSILSKVLREAKQSNKQSFMNRSENTIFNIVTPRNHDSNEIKPMHMNRFGTRNSITLKNPSQSIKTESFFRQNSGSITNRDRPSIQNQKVMTRNPSGFILQK